MSAMMRGWIRPLSMPSIAVMPGDTPRRSIKPLDLLRDISREYADDPRNAIKERYVKLSTEQLDLFIVPAEKKILEKIVWPLKSAKAAYCLADYLACLALCGMVAEMAVIFLYDLVAPNSDITKLPEKHQKVLRGFEGQDQRRRIRGLRALGALPEDLSQDAHRICDLRREYLHLLTKDFAKLEADAYAAYVCAFRIVDAVVGLPLGDKGALAVPARLRGYLEQKGVLGPNEA